MERVARCVCWSLPWNNTAVFCSTQLHFGDCSSMPEKFTEIAISYVFHMTIWMCLRSQGLFWAFCWYMCCLMLFIASIHLFRPQKWMNSPLPPPYTSEQPAICAIFCFMRELVSRGLFYYVESILQPFQSTFQPRKIRTNSQIACCDSKYKFIAINESHTRECWARCSEMRALK